MECHSVARAHCGRERTKGWGDRRPHVTYNVDLCMSEIAAKPPFIFRVFELKGG